MFTLKTGIGMTLVCTLAAYSRRKAFPVLFLSRANAASVQALRIGIPRASLGIMPAVAPFKEYNARVDARKRVVLRGAKHDYFRVLPRRDGTFVLKPCVMVDAPIAPEAIRCIGKSIASMKAGKRSKPEDLKKLAALKI